MTLSSRDRKASSSLATSTAPQAYELSGDDTVILAYGGELRLCYPKACEVCGKTFYRPKHLLIRSRFCSHSCAAEARKDRFTATCANCGTTLSLPKARAKGSRSGLYFCSRKCKDRGQSLSSGLVELWPDHYGKYSDYRKRAFDSYGELCARCGYNDDSDYLDVHHVNGCRDDNAIENLQVLCVSCHAIETRRRQIERWRKPGGLV